MREASLSLPSMLPSLFGRSRIAVIDCPIRRSHVSVSFIGSYRLVYLVEKERGLIVAVLHGHRALSRALKDRP